MKHPLNPKLTIVGAGPGDVELITLKAIKALQTADVVLYDALVNEELLQYAPQANCIFVGKRLGCHAYSQDQINELIVSQAKRYGHVVRLKGGDPFVFGRGSEEIAYAQQFDIATAIVPGISSALGVPASNGISLTQRKVSESFWVITGTTSDHKLSKDVSLASQSSATVVILMGMHKLDEIISIYQKNRTDDLPVAIIQNGTTQNEKKAIGEISLNPPPTIPPAAKNPFASLMIRGFWTSQSFCFGSSKSRSSSESSLSIKLLITWRWI